MACGNCPCPDVCLQRQDFCDLAAKSPPVEIELRHICARSKLSLSPRAPDASVPPLATQIVYAAGALGRVVSAVATGQAVKVSQEVLDKRRGACETCENMLGDRCKLCGCWYQTKIRLATESCPMSPPKWTAYNDLA
jgi:hypothetical protein